MGPTNTYLVNGMSHAQNKLYQVQTLKYIFKRENWIIGRDCEVKSY